MFVALGVRVVIFDPFEPFVPPQFGIKLATEAWERSEAAALRRLVFCREQRLFVDDADEIDSVATPIVAVDYMMGMAHRVVGGVRIHEAEDGCWYGSRLAIDPEYRNVYGLGSGLVHRAVTTAHGRGARVFLAHVQERNVPFFRRLAWDALEPCVRFGAPHMLMRADLRAYPPAYPDQPVAVLRTGRAS